MTIKTYSTLPLCNPINWGPGSTGSALPTSQQIPYELCFEELRIIVCMADEKRLYNPYFTNGNCYSISTVAQQRLCTNNDAPNKEVMYGI